MRIVEPNRPLVVKIGQSARFQDRRGFWVYRDDTVGTARHDLRQPLDEIGRVQPRLAQSI